MRVIDADELKEVIRWSEVCRLSILEILQIIDDIPTVEHIISAKDFKKRINNMEYVYIQDCAEDVIDAIDCEETYFKEKQNNGKK